jgi:7-cyano-7-deazaguanine synthase
MTPSRTAACALVSGGVDSGILLHRLIAQGVRVTPLYVRCGLRWEAAELYWLRRLLRALQGDLLRPLAILEVPASPLYGAHWAFAGPVPSARSADQAVYLPGRNLLLLSAAAVFAARQRLPAVALGVLAGNPFGDARPGFLRRFGACAGLALGAPVHVLAPLRHLSKTQALLVGRRAPLALTFSCLAPRGRRHCGRCNKCAERRRAFRDAGLSDPTRYVR